MARLGAWDGGDVACGAWGVGRGAWDVGFPHFSATRDCSCHLSHGLTTIPHFTPFPPHFSISRIFPRVFRSWDFRGLGALCLKVTELQVWYAVCCCHCTDFHGIKTIGRYVDSGAYGAGSHTSVLQWEPSFILAEYVMDNRQSISGKRVIELGSGVAVCCLV